MMQERSYKKELLDEDDISLSDINRNLYELDRINTLLNGHKIINQAVRNLLKRAMHPNGDELYIVEIGSGGGDNLLAVHNYLKQHNIKHRLTGVDIKQDCLNYAAQKYAHIPARWLCSDYKNLNFSKEQPDIIFSSLFCHHFTNVTLVEQLLWMKENSRMGFFISDLHRHPVAYHAIKILTRLFSKSALVKNDAPLSIQRAFVRSDWQELLKKAGIERYSLEWKWAFRYLICVANER